MRILFIVSSFNSLTQKVFCYLKDEGHKLSVEFAIDEESMIKAAKSFKPDLILSPFLKKYVPKEIYENIPVFIFHPGIRGDRGANSLDYALLKREKIWGAVFLKADKEIDAGDIYSESFFPVREAPKSSLYRKEVSDSAVKMLKELLENIKDPSFKPKKQILNPVHKILTQKERKIDWFNDSTKDIIRKINAADSYPGVKDEFLGMECYLFGAHYEKKLRGGVKEILAKRDGAVCVGTKDAAVWISHLKEPKRFKLPSTYVLKERLKGVKEHRLPLIFDQSYETFYEIYTKEAGDVVYLHFDFHNGAMGSEQCIRLKYAIEYLKQKCKVLVLMGGRDFFSNGIHLNILEDSKKQGEDGWSNINAMNDLIKSVLFCDEIITVASFGANAGAGGVFLGLACDYVIARDGVVLNPHYKTLGLSGSEYHTFTLPKRVGEKMSKKLKDDSLPVSVKRAKEISMVDEVFENENYFESLDTFCQNLLKDEDKYDDFIYDKQDFLDENKEYINSCKERELEIMYPEFWDENSSFHRLRREFVYKICPIFTPKRLKDIDA